MSSSTFSSDPPGAMPPHKPWIASWLLSLLLAASLIGGAEMYWRTQGHRPSAPDSNDLWAYHRSRARSSNETVVVLGASRIQTAFSAPVFRAMLPQYRLVQLADYGGGSAIGTLLDLAADEEFTGVVICDIIAPFLYRARWNNQRMLHEHRLHRRELFELLPRWWLRTQLVAANPNLRLTAMLRSGRFPEPGLVRLRFDRCVELDFSVVANLDELRDEMNAHYRAKYRALQNAASEDSFAEGFAELREAIARIRSRGGQVVFVRCPSSGDRRKLEEQYHPKAQFWDRLVDANMAECIHFLDIPAMRSLECPDDSHLDVNEARRFTRTLLRELTSRRVLRSRSRG